jgi:hypothetical protein
MDLKKTVYPEICVFLSPSKEDYQKISAEFKAATGSDNPYDNKDLHDEIYRKYMRKDVLNNCTLYDAQVYAEPIRIQHPDRNVSITANKAYIGNTTWEDQMQMFFEYEVYTPEGKKLQEEARIRAKAENRVASFE